MARSSLKLTPALWALWALWALLAGFAFVTPTVRLRGMRGTPESLISSGALVKESTGPAPRLGQGYAAVSVLTLVSWTLCAVMALARHPAVIKLPLRHNVLTVAQALTPLPLGCAVLGMTYRRLNLAIFMLSLWLAAATAFAPSFARGYQLYPKGFAVGITLCHSICAAYCLTVWLKSVMPSPQPIAGHYLPRLVRGIVGSFWALFPATSETLSISSSGSASHLDDPESTAGSDGRNEYSMATVLFLCFAVMPFLVSFPFAGVATVGLGPLSRAGAAWTFLAAVAAYVLKDATQRGRIHSGKTFRYLRWGFVASSGSHLLLVALTFAGMDGGRAALHKFYAGTMSCPKLAWLSLVMHALVVFAALTPPPKVAKAANTPPAAPTFEEPLPPPPPDPVVSPSPVAPVAAPVVSSGYCSPPAQVCAPPVIVPQRVRCISPRHGEAQALNTNASVSPAAQRYTAIAESQALRKPHQSIVCIIGAETTGTKELSTFLAQEFRPSTCHFRRLPESVTFAVFGGVLQAFSDGFKDPSRLWNQSLQQHRLQDQDNLETMCRIGDVYVILGSPEASCIAQRALQRGAAVVPIQRTGEMPKLPSEVFDCPSFVNESCWALLSDSEAPLAATAAAASAVVAGALAGKQAPPKWTPSRSPFGGSVHVPMPQRATLSWVDSATVMAWRHLASLSAGAIHQVAGRGRFTSSLLLLCRRWALARVTLQAPSIKLCQVQLCGMPEKFVLPGALQWSAPSLDAKDVNGVEGLDASTPGHAQKPRLLGRRNHATYFQHSRSQKAH
eukprot:g29192.t1